MPGDAFGVSGEGHLRCCFATALDAVETAMTLVAMTLVGMTLSAITEVAKTAIPLSISVKGQRVRVKLAPRPSFVASQDFRHKHSAI